MSAEFREKARETLENLSLQDRWTTISGPIQIKGVKGSVFIQGFNSNGRLQFIHNLGGGPPPKKITASRILNGIRTEIQNQMNAYEDLRLFMENHPTQYQLVVWSGQMDIEVATMDFEGEIVWHSNID